MYDPIHVTAFWKWGLRVGFVFDEVRPPMYPIGPGNFETTILFAGRFARLLPSKAVHVCVYVCLLTIVCVCVCVCLCVCPLDCIYCLQSFSQWESGTPSSF